MNKVVAFSGPRDIGIPQEEIAVVFRTILGNELPKRVLLGGATGVDTCVAEYVMEEFDMIPRIYPPWWKYYNKAAGPIRNIEMIEDCDIAVVLKDLGRNTPGTTSFAKFAEVTGKLSILYPSEYYFILDEKEGKEHKLKVARKFKQMKLNQLRRAYG